MKTPLIAIASAVLLLASTTTGSMAVSAPPAFTDWPMYLSDIGHSGYATGEDLISRSTASSLITRFRLQTGSPVSAQPTVAAGMIFWGSWDGKEHATTIFGKPLWTTFVGKTTGGSGCEPSEVGVAGTAAYERVKISGQMRSVLFVAGGDHSLYALDAITGAVIWKTALGSSNADFLWDSPVVFAGSVYLGVASFGDCPIIRGGLFQLSTSSGAIQHILYATPPGCLGNGIWATPTVDESAGAIYVATGNPGRCKNGEPLGEAMIELRASDLSILGHWSLPHDQRGSDTDFGATPTLFSYQSGGTLHQLVGSLNKNGVYYAFRREHLDAGPVWTAQIGTTPNASGVYIAPSAWDGHTLYVGGGTASIAGQKCQGNLRALSPGNGSFLWQDCLPASVYAAVVTAPGIVEASGGNRIIIVGSRQGLTLLDKTFRGATFWGPASISGGTLYQGDMNGRLYALSPSGYF